MFSKGNKILRETLDLTTIATKEIDQIKTEIDIQNEKLFNIQQKNGINSTLLHQSDSYLNDIFKNTKFGMVLMFLFVIIFALTILFIKINYF